MTSQKKMIGVLVFLFFLISSPTIASGPVHCVDLAGIIAGDPTVKSVTSAIQPASGSTPAYCRVDILYGTNPDQNINIRVGLPLNSVDGGTGGVQGAWNGRTQGIGGGG